MASERAPIKHPESPCTKCGTATTALDRFPDGLCLTCYTPIGERMAATMTAEKLAKMWGAKL